MIDNIPPWLAIILVVTLVPVAVYLSWILPGYVADNEAAAENEKDRVERLAQSGAE